MKKLIVGTLFTALVLTGCKTNTQYIDPADAEQNITVGLSYADFQLAAQTMADEMIASPLLVHPKAAQGGRYILHVNNITNDTMQRVDTDQLVKTIRVRLLNSGKFVVTTAFNGEDNMTKDVRGLSDSEMVKKSSVKKSGTVLAPDYSLSGKILQRNASLDNGDTRIEYYFQLTLTNLENGLAYWEGEKVIGKLSGADTVAW
ncbi:penicillin-binding protein activator LpoB [Motilimonas pumila]|uniref:Penicillin-binding protein activator LpoB n=1 Tax=Motilimonas pumila TaxID=2303987 RepID=A0A418Y9S6_9GAMM|nr:penicillin-binding protein activator LpoB [Motilimonas pumila]RJG38266.1 penicillin-binding protein activator LpoB [Motilimonas pumila]